MKATRLVLGLCFISLGVRALVDAVNFPAGPDIVIRALGVVMIVVGVICAACAFRATGGMDL